MTAFEQAVPSKEAITAAQEAYNQWPALSDESLSAALRAAYAVDFPGVSARRTMAHEFEQAVEAALRPFLVRAMGAFVPGMDCGEPGTLEYNKRCADFVLANSELAPGVAAAIQQGHDAWVREFQLLPTRPDAGPDHLWDSWREAALAALRGDAP